MKVLLNEIATLNTGYPFRSKFSHDPDGNVGVVQMKNLGDDNIVKFDNLDKYLIEDPKENHLIEEGDLLFRSRGLNFTAAIAKNNIENTIYVSPIFRIRVTSDSILPDYLKWYIESKPAQDYFNLETNGMVLRSVNIKTLSNLVLTIPSVEIQQIIIDLVDTSKQEIEKLNELAKYKKLYTEKRILEIISEAKDD